MAIARLREGAGGYPIWCVAPALAASGQVEAAIAAARQIPDKRELIGALGKIAVIMAGQGRSADAIAVLDESVRVLEILLHASISNWSHAGELLNAAAVLGVASSLDHLQNLDIEKDPVWHAWFLAGLARAHQRSKADVARVTQLAQASVRVLREASRAGPLRGEAVRAETAGFLAEAGTLTEAVAIATDIEDGQYQKTALIAIAMPLLRTGRAKEAREFLLQAMVSGAPDPLTHAVDVAHGAKALARLADTERALRAIEPCLQRVAALSPEGWARAEVLALAVDLFEMCDRPDRARQEAANALALLVRPESEVVDDRLRRQIVYFAGKTIGEEPLESSVSRSRNWFYRRTIAAGAVRAFNARGLPERSQQFFDELDSDRLGYPPWDETTKADALGRMFEIPDDQVRPWVRRAAESLRTPAVRSVLMARLAGTLAKEGLPDAASVARLALDAAAQIDVQPARAAAFAEVAKAFAQAGQADLTLEALASVTEAEVISQAIGSLAMALVEQRQSAQAVGAVRSIAGDSERSYWTTMVGERLLRAQQYQEARGLLCQMPGWTEVVAQDFAIAHCAVAMARDGHAEEAYRLVEPVVLRAEARPASRDSSDDALVTAETALALGHMGAHERSVALAHLAVEQDAGRWGPFVSGAVAACYTLAGDRPARRHAARRPSGVCSEQSRKTSRLGWR